MSFIQFSLVQSSNIKDLSRDRKSLPFFNSNTKTLLFFLFLMYFTGSIQADVFPKDNSTLNYTTVYFEEEWTDKAIRYELFVYSDSLMTHLLRKAENKVPAFWVSDLAWATRYFWQVKAFHQNGERLSASAIHSFRIMKIAYQSYDEIRIDVIKNNKEKHSGGLISLDYTRSIINREGKPVWTIPPVDSIEIKNTHIRDLRITADNTITFLTIRVPYEIDFSGKLLWKAPFPCIFKGDTVIYHHDFKKTKRGTYMVLGDRKVYRRLFGNYSDEALKLEPDAIKIDGIIYKRTLVTLLLEFDRSGKIIWYWDANEYIDDVDFNYKKNPTGVSNFATHANAFSENEQGTKVYVGFRDLSRVVKIDKRTKVVETSYGERYPSGEARIPVKMLNQHDANVTNHNSIYVFNNNGFKNEEGVSSILELKDNAGPKDSVVLWKFDLNFDTLSKGKSANGGDIVELSPNNLLFCAGALNRVFEITKEKEIVWDAFLYSRGINDTLWQAFIQYRANWIKQLNWYYFIAQLTKPNSNADDVEFSLTNTGNCDDSYRIEVYSANNKLINEFYTKVLTNNESYSEVFKMTNRSKNGRVGSIRIKSQSTGKIILLK